MILMNRCKLIKAGGNGSWEILRCPGSNGSLHYVIRAWEEKIEHIVEAFVKAKEEGYIKELTTIYVMECREEWIGAMGIYDVALNVAVSDYSKKECMDRFMEIVTAVIKKLSEVKE